MNGALTFVPLLPRFVQLHPKNVRYKQCFEHIYSGQSIYVTMNDTCTCANIVMQLNLLKLYMDLHYNPRTIITIGDFHNVFKFHAYSVNKRLFLTTARLVRGLSDVATTNVCKVDTSNRNHNERSR